MTLDCVECRNECKIFLFWGTAQNISLSRRTMLELMRHYEMFKNVVHS
jgi:hypothetical protein